MILSRHAFRRTARAKRDAIEQVRDHYLGQQPESYRTWLRNSKDYHGLLRNVPNWATVFRAERAGRGPFSWVVRAYSGQPVK